MEEGKTITREELYDLVWSKPLTALATELGVSNVGLAKICDRLAVPRPRSGYWLSAAHQKAPRPTLPPRQANVCGEVTIKPQPKRDTDVVLDVVVPTRLTKPHPITAKIVAALENAHADSEGQLYARDMPGCPVRTSKEQKARAIRILDAAIMAVEARGHTVRLEKGYDSWSLCAVSGHDNVPFRIREKLGQKKHEPTKSELSSSGYYYSRPRFDHFAKGELLLELEGYYDSSIQRRWADTKRQRLDEKVGGFVLALERALEDKRQSREEWERRRREEEEYRRRVEEERRRAELEQKRIERLQDLAAAWRAASTIRAFVDALEGELGSSADTKGTLAWARDVAERMDPIRDAAGTIAELESEPDATR